MSAQTVTPCLFLSHSGADTDAARELKKRILSSADAKTAGLRVWLDKDDLAAGVGWQAQLEKAITEEATAFAVHVGANGVVNWVESEVRLGLTRATSAPDFPFIPILAKECSGPESLPAFARQYQAVRDPLNNSEELQNLVGAILRRSRAERVVVLDEPFVGLHAMKESDSERFFGRSEEVAELIDKLKGSRLIAVVAESGAGKSSLVQAGLIPRFRGGALSAAGGREPQDRLWHVVVMRPGGDPIEGLKKGITETAERLGRSGDQCAGLRKRIDIMDASETAYAIRCDLSASRTETLLIVDQFEELLTETPEANRAPFVDLLMKLAAAGGFRIVLTLRADYFNLCRPLSNLFEHLSKNNQDCIVRLRRITDQGIDEAVRKPLRLAGHTDISEQDAVIAAIRRDVSDRAGDLALVQMALYSMWQKHRLDRSSLLVAYNQVGGVAGALAHEAEQVRTGTLTAAERDLLLPVFVRLVRLGETGGATRRHADLADFEIARRNLAVKLATKDCARLLLAGEKSIEIAHEALITQWPWLQNMLQGAAADMRVLDRLTDKTRRWTSEAKNREHLAAGAEREEFSALARRRQDWVSSPEVQFVEASNRAHRHRFYLKAAAQAALVALVVLSGALAYRAVRASKQERAARQEATAALDQSLSTQSRFLADLAQQNIRAGDAGAAMLLALEGLPDLRSGKARPVVPEAEAALFKAYRELREALLLQGHEGPLWSASFAPDGRRIVTTSDDKTARLWDAETGNQLAVLGRHKDVLRFAAFSPDGQMVITTSGDRTARLWSVNTNDELAALLGHTDVVWNASFSPDGRRVVTASSDNTARVWDVGTGKEIFRLDRHTGPVRAAVFSRDGQFVVTASEDTTARLWNSQTGEPVRIFEGHSAAVRVAAFDPEAKHLLTASLDKTARLWNVQTGVQIAELKGHTSAVLSAAFNPDGQRVVTASVDGAVRLWNARDGTATARLEGHAGAVVSTQFSRDGRTLLTASDDRSARIWDVDTGAMKAALHGHSGRLRSATFSPDDKRVVTASTDGTARSWNVEPELRRPIIALQGHRQPVNKASFSPDRRLVVTASEDRSAIIWDVKAAKPRHTLRGHTAPVLSAVFSPDGRRVATASEDQTARIWDAQTGNQIGGALRSQGGEVRSLVFSPDGTQVAFATSSGIAQLHDVEAGKQIAVFKGHVGDVYSIMFGPAAKQIVTTGKDRTTRFWDAETGREITSSSQSGQGHLAGLGNAAISPDAKHVVTVGGDDTPRLWDAHTGALVALLQGHQGSGLSAAFSPGGERIATAADDGTVRIWDIKTAKAVAVLEDVEKVVDVAFSHDGEWIVTVAEDFAQIWPVFPSLQKLVDNAKSRLSRCLTDVQRRQAFLDPQPPPWCSEEKKWLGPTAEGDRADVAVQPPQAR